ncbi:MAG: hypothetical protein LBJ95_03565 [Oscillospiraceae bacterium]|nr:hypothetical protein [Oscillospiraceae bacterium]
MRKFKQILCTLTLALLTASTFHTQTHAESVFTRVEILNASDDCIDIRVTRGYAPDTGESMSLDYTLLDWDLINQRWVVFERVFRRSFDDIEHGGTFATRLPGPDANVACIASCQTFDNGAYYEHRRYWIPGRILTNTPLELYGMLNTDATPGEIFFAAAKVDGIFGCAPEESMMRSSIPMVYQMPNELASQLKSLQEVVIQYPENEPYAKALYAVNIKFTVNGEQLPCRKLDTDIFTRWPGQVRNGECYIVMVPKNLSPDQAIMMEIAKNDFDHGTVVVSDKVPVEVVEIP